MRFLSPHAVSVANHRGDGVDDRLRDGASNFGWKPPEVISLFRPEGNRVIAVMVDPIAGPGLTILTLTRRNMISFGLWEEFPDRRFRGHKVAKCDCSKSVKACRHLAEGCCSSEARAISAVVEKMQTTETSVPVASCSPQNSFNGATFADGCKPERNTSTKFNRSVFQGVVCRRSNPLPGGAELHSGWAARKGAEIFSQGGTRRRAGCGGTHVYPRQAVCERSSAVASSILP